MKLNENLFNSLYGSFANKKEYKDRYLSLKTEAKNRYGITTGAFFSVAGRTELAGNHTDHNHGLVLAGSVNLDSLGYGVATNDNIIKIYDLGFKQEFIVDLAKIDKSVSQSETTEALIRGVADYYKQHNYKIGGFNLISHSSVIAGGGLSSSASFEGLVAYVLNYLYNDEKVDTIFMGIASRYAENVHFGKPCGLMDQLACLHGGVVSIDFKETNKPIIKSANVDFTSYGLQLCIVDTNSSHEGLTEGYASMPIEMKSVAKFFGKEVLREVNTDEFFSKINEARSKCGDRAVLRAIHFFADSERVAKMIEALNKEDIIGYLALVNDSGNSSSSYLQNVVLPNRNDMSMALALALSGKILAEKGAYRVHGGGFAGAIQVYVPLALFASYKKEMEKYFGENSVKPLTIRSTPACHMEDDLSWLLA